MTSRLHFEQKDVPVIDVHYHNFAPHVLKPMGEFVIAAPDAAPDETPDAMKKLGTSAVIYSPAKEVQKLPSQRGSFAPLPLPHVAESIEALRYGEEECVPKPDGYAITTSANNIYLGDPAYDEILRECDHRKVVLFVHPSETVMPPLDGRTYGFQMIEFPTETARCLMTMIDQGTFTRYPNISWIFSHNGGSFPFLFQRVIRTLSGSKLIGAGGPGAQQTNRIAKSNNGKTLQEVFAGGNIYIECSQGTAAQQVLLKSMGLGAENILTGSDWPFTGKVEVEATLKEMHGPELSGLYNTREIAGIRSGNALQLLPRLKIEWIKAGLVREV